MTEQNEQKIYKGLAGVLADYTAVSKVMPETNSLTYRGYPCLLYTSPSPRDVEESRMPSSA